MLEIDKIINQYASAHLTKQDFFAEMNKRYSTLMEFCPFLENNFIDRIYISSNGVEFRTRYGCHFLNAHSDHYYPPKGAISLGNSTVPELDLMMAFMKDCRIVFDIGANIGWMSIHFANRYPDKQIYSFEPILPTYETFLKNISCNPGVKNIQYYNLGFAEKPGEFDFFYYPNIPAASSLKNDNYHENVVLLKCSILTLDDFTQKEEVSPDFIKIDVEGAELPLLQGGLRTITENKPILFVEMLRKWSAKFGYHPNDIIQLLTPLEYHCFSLEGNKIKPFLHMREDSVEKDFVFLHGSKHAKLIAENKL
ncbi:MAG: hypothetical protein CSA25_04185 [Desulfobacter postgatei]|uniref:Methyltransferase FkbM domain-containing protein n=1 Tax=Desulfobacter postgatei TaxID=2293 RepID=A0A2G6MRF7_9BACT|nr:MAG: hypothetical protein CSA25_04185 [Desulfobacter postgatei]